MAGSTISTTITTEVTLGTGVFLSPLTVTATGHVLGPAPTNTLQAAAAIYLGPNVTGASLLNRGQIAGILPKFDSISVPAILADSPLTLNNYSTIVGQSGVYLNAGGTVTNAGLIAGSDARSAHDYGIRLIDATLVNSGTVYGAKYGVADWNLSEVKNSGTILGDLAGVDLISSSAAYRGTLINTGSIYSNQTGITASQALITNSGTVTGETYGIHIAWGATLTNSGRITGGVDGVLLLNQQYQLSEDSSLVNSGSIAGGYFGVAINFSSVTNSATGTISGQTFGVGVGESGYLLTAGALYGKYAGLTAENGGLAVNNNTIRGGMTGAILFSGSALTNTSGGYIHGGTIGLRDQGGYLLNAGTLAGSSYGLSLLGGGIAVTSGKITSQNEGIYLSNVYATAASDFLINSGTVYGRNAGIVLKNGTLYNSGGISGGPIGASLVSGATLISTGHIYGQKYGVQLAGGTIVNSGTIIGKQIGAELAHGYLFNSGTISGATYAVSGQGFTLGVGPGDVFSGKVADSSNTSTLDLGGSAFATFSGLGTTFSGFEDINFEAGAHWLLSGTTAALSNHQTINGINYGDTILVSGFTATGDIYYVGRGMALFYGNGGPSILIDITGTFVGQNYLVTESSLGTEISLIPCFAEGARILTSSGEIAVQDLHIGDTVITLSAGDMPIIWIGKRTIDLGRHPRPETVQPICITANALAENVPKRNLFVSPDHALFIDGYLIPAKALLNRSTIYQCQRREVTYYHIELARHAVVFAEHAAVESYLETGNRVLFENGGEADLLHPDFGEAVRRQQSCATLLEAGDALDSVRARLAQRQTARKPPTSRLQVMQV